MYEFNPFEYESNSFEIGEMYDKGNNYYIAEVGFHYGEWNSSNKANIFIQNGKIIDKTMTAEHHFPKETLEETEKIHLLELSHYEERYLKAAIVFEQIKKFQTFDFIHLRMEERSDYYEVSFDLKGFDDGFEMNFYKPHSKFRSPLPSLLINSVPIISDKVAFFTDYFFNKSKYRLRLLPLKDHYMPF